MTKTGKTATRSTATAPTAANAARAPSKSDRIVKRLNSTKGASIIDLCTLTGWQVHTVRAALSRLRKAGHAIERAAGKDGKSFYKITSEVESGT